MTSFSGGTMTLLQPPPVGGLGLQRGSWASQQKKLDLGTDSKVHSNPE